MTKRVTHVEPVSLDKAHEVASTVYQWATLIAGVASLAMMAITAARGNGDHSA